MVFNDHHTRFLVRAFSYTEQASHTQFFHGFFVEDGNVKTQRTGKFHAFFSHKLRCAEICRHISVLFGHLNTDTDGYAFGISFFNVLVFIRNVEVNVFRLLPVDVKRFVVLRAIKGCAGNKTGLFGDPFRNFIRQPLKGGQDDFFAKVSIVDTEF